MNYGWALFTPTGKIVMETFGRTKGEVEGHAYAYLASTRDWPAAFWKMWKPFVKQRERRGWYIRPVCLVQCPRKQRYR